MLTLWFSDFSISVAFEVVLFGGLMRLIGILLCFVVYSFQVGVASAQGVRSSCPTGDCGGGSISPWFYAYALGAFVLFNFYYFVFGSKADYLNAKYNLLVVLKLTILFVGMPSAAFVFFDNGGEAAIYSFFAILIYFTFGTKLGNWVLPNKDKDEDAK